MKKESSFFRLVIGLLLTVLIYFTSLIVGNLLHIETDFVPSSFSTHALMLVMSVVLILVMKKQVCYRIAFPKIKQIFKPILFGFLSAVVINIALGVLIAIISGGAEKHPAMANASVLQFLLFDFILASVAEEFLFRGFLQNLLKPLSAKGFKLFRRKISLPVIISALAFAAAHLILIASGVSALFIVRILVFTFVLGLIAGYYQEKHDNHAFAIIVHMSGNLMGLISVMIA